jgi:MYND finger
MTDNYAVLAQKETTPLNNLCCRICGINSNLRRCSKCKTAHYCCQEHQRLDWKQHKPDCKRIQQKLDNTMATDSMANSLFHNTSPLRTNQEYANSNNPEATNNRFCGFNIGRNLVFSCLYFIRLFLDFRFPFFFRCTTEQSTTTTTNNSSQHQRNISCDGNDVVNAADLEMFVRAELLGNNSLSNQKSNTTNWLDQQKPTIDLASYDFGSEQRQHQNIVVVDSTLVNGYTNNQKNSNSKPTTLNGFGSQTGHELNPDDLFELLAQATEDGGASSKENHHHHHQQQQMFKTNTIMHINASEKFLNSSKLSQDYTDEEQWGLEDMCANLIRDMNQYGVCVLDNFLGNEKGLKVLDEVTGMHTAGVFKVE